MIAVFGLSLSHTQASLLTVVSYLVGATGPLMTGFLRDANGSFEAPLWLLVAVSAAMLATTPFLNPIITAWLPRQDVRGSSPTTKESQNEGLYHRYRRRRRPPDS